MAHYTRPITPVRLLGPVAPSCNGPLPIHQLTRPQTPLLPTQPTSFKGNPPIHQPLRQPTSLLRPKSPQPVKQSFHSIHSKKQDLNSTNDSLQSDHSDLLDDLPPTLKASAFASPPGSTLTTSDGSSDPDIHEHHQSLNRWISSASTKSKNYHQNVFKTKGIPPRTRRDREYSAISHLQHQKQQDKLNYKDENNPIVKRMQSDGWFSNDKSKNHYKHKQNSYQKNQQKQKDSNHPATLKYSNSIDGRRTPYPKSVLSSSAKKISRIKLMPQTSDMGPNRLAERAEIYKNSGYRETNRRGYNDQPYQQQGWERRVRSVDREYDQPRPRKHPIIEEDDTWGGYQKRKMLPLRKIVWTCRRAFYRATGDWEHRG